MQHTSDVEGDPERDNVTLYDVVAGRANFDGLIEDTAPPTHRDRANYDTQAVLPGDFLFRHPDAPERIREDDVYAAHGRLRPDQRLPPSDLLKAIHAYASDFYAQVAESVDECDETGSDESKEKCDERSLDETALLAIGILLEEAAADAIGETGDLALLQSSVEHRRGIPLIDRSQSEEDDRKAAGMKIEMPRKVIDSSREARSVSRSRSVKREVKDGRSTSRAPSLKR